MDAESLTPGDGGPAEPFGTRRARALRRLAEIALAADLDDLPDPSGERYQVLVVADEAGAHLDPGPTITDTTARRLACDAARTLLRTRQGQPLDAGDTTRGPTRRQRRALRRRDGGCRYPGCDRTAFLHAHHVVHWADGGPIDLDNLLLLCSFHHHLVHEGGWTVTGHPARAPRFHGPDGRVVTSAPSQAATGPDLATRNQRAGIHVDHATAVSMWDGTHLDLAAAVDAITPHHAQRPSRS